jgi:hypothetical protein
MQYIADQSYNHQNKLIKTKQIKQDYETKD